MHGFFRARRCLPWMVGLFVVGLGLLVGCGGPNDALNRQAVSGQVVLGDQAIDAGSISFEPQGEGPGIAGGAVIEAGKFELPRTRGLPPGKYTVRISSPDTSAQKVAVDDMPGELGRALPERVPAEWNSKTTQTVEIQDRGKNHFEFKIP